MKSLLQFKVPFGVKVLRPRRVVVSIVEMVGRSSLMDFYHKRRDIFTRIRTFVDTFLNKEFIRQIVCKAPSFNYSSPLDQLSSTSLSMHSLAFGSFLVLLSQLSLISPIADILSCPLSHLPQNISINSFTSTLKKFVNDFNFRLNLKIDHISDFDINIV